MNITDMMTSYRISCGSKTIFLIFVLLLSQISTSLFAQTTDRRNQTPPSNQGMGIDITRSSTSFYYVDQIGMQLGMLGIPANDIIDEQSYKLGPGDLLTITLTGNISGVFRGLIVNQQGEIVMPNVGTVSVNGLLLAEAKSEIEVAVSRTFRETQTSLTLERPRMIKIHVAGDIPNPGSYFVPAQTRLDRAIVRALFQPTVRLDIETGESVTDMPGISRFFLIDGRFSTRNISIQRGEENRIEADLVAYGIGGDLNANPVVHHEDIITIYAKELYAPQISVSGAVVSSLNLEYRPDDSVARLLDMAGGLAVDSNPNDIRVFRQQNGRVESFAVHSNDMMTPMQPNDRIVVGFDREARSNKSAWVFGEAVSPGNFPVRAGESSILDLLEMAGGLTSNALPNGAYLIRRQPESTFFDGESAERRVRRQQSMSTPPIFSNNFNLTDPEMLREMITNPAFNAEQLKRSSDQYLEGFDYLNLEAILNRNEVYIDLNNLEQLSATKVYGGDELYIPRDDKNVFVMGQVRNPGYYAFDSNRSGVDYVRNAGGFALAADESRTFVIKAGSKAWFKVNETTVESGDIIFVDRVPFDNLVSARQNEFQQRELRNRNIQLVFAGIATIASVITAYVAVTR